ncbi:hypothetical protein [Kibdelosporangium phytohabitans]|uniref:hypothetical protein n=1 Tax=Kibdelosporangium phytohabitans TaxID=860235 RepID=UPI0012F98007|nr:hypothetical protein [Kibdelosporangium phytohabitans]MBE1471103.1 hypothetical protein [Kibdelosporangium phytohabitans]
MRTRERLTPAMLAIAGLLVVVAATALITDGPRTQVTFMAAATLLLAMTMSTGRAISGNPAQHPTSGAGERSPAALAAGQGRGGQPGPSSDGGSFSLAAGASPLPPG